MRSDRAPQRRHAFGKAVVRWRERRGMQAKDLAEAVGITQPTLSKYETTQTPPVSLLMFLEWDLEPPVPIRELRRYARPLMRIDVYDRWMRDRARLIRIIGEARKGKKWHFEE